MKKKLCGILAICLATAAVLAGCGKQGQGSDPVPGGQNQGGESAEGQQESSQPAEQEQEELLSGKVLVALMGPGHFTNRGHFILLRGITLDGSILVADPASPERSLTTWDLELILGELGSQKT